MKLGLVGLLICLLHTPTARSQTLVDSFVSPGKEPRGLAWDGEYLWCADAQVDSVYQLEPSSGSIVSSFRPPFGILDSYGGITWGRDSTIWLANGSVIYELSPVTGGILYQTDCT